MARIEPLDIDTSTDPANIEKILTYLSHLGDVPLDAVQVLRSALAEAAERAAIAERRAEPETANRGVKTVSMKPARRKGYDRDVPLVERAYTCRHCGRVVTLDAYPSAALPTVCDRVGCRELETERLRRANAERQRRWREQHKSAKKG